MTTKRTQIPAIIWMIALAVGMIVHIPQLTWRQTVWFGAVLVILALAKRFQAAKKLESVLMLVFVVGIVFVVFDPLRTQPGNLSQIMIGLSLIGGTLAVIVGLLGLRWIRPVGGIVDSLIILFCILFPVVTLLLQVFVSRHFTVFPISVGVSVRAWQMLAVLAAYLTLSQWLLQDTRLKAKIRPFYWVLFVVIIVSGSVRWTLLQRELARLQSHPDKIEESSLGFALPRAKALDYHSAQQWLAIQYGSLLYRQGNTEGALVMLGISQQWWREKEIRSQLDRSIEDKTLVALAAGTTPFPKGSAKAVSMVIDSYRKRFIVLDVKGHLRVWQPEGWQDLGQVKRAGDLGVARDLVFDQENKHLYVLFENGTVIRVRLAVEKEGETVRYQILDRKEVCRKRNSAARVLAQQPGTERLVLACGDFSICSASGKITNWMKPAGRPIRKGQDLLRDFQVLDSGRGGYILDAYSGIHPLGDTPIRYDDLAHHAKQRYHYWSGKDIARALAVSRDGYRLCVFDAYGGIHCIQKDQEGGPVRFFGSVRAFIPKPDVVDSIQTYDSFYVLHRDGQIDRRVGMRQIFQAYAKRKDQLGILPLVFMVILGWIMLRSPRRIPSTRNEFQDKAGVEREEKA